jgi:hypothetical protein
MLPVSVGESPDSWICMSTSGSTYACRDCPGLQVCTCLYVGAGCPSSDIVCNRAPIMIAGVWIYGADPQPCYWSRQCYSPYGGACDPQSNPCVKDDAIGLMGTLNVPKLTGECI